MKPLRARLEEARKRLALPWEIIERDYVLSWVLAGIARVPSLRETLVFKGGTALKKCYFGEYRFSEDLDFSALPGALTGKAMEAAVNEACKTASKLLDEYAPVVIACERYLEKHPHPGGQEAFTIRAALPWQRGTTTRVLIEISMDEKVLKSVSMRSIIHEYGEPLDAQVLVYSLEEIVAEKLRAILQHAERLKDRGWSRSRARDFYDLWRILGAYKARLDLSGFASFLRKKCALKKISFTGPESFFQEAPLAFVEKTWQQWMGPLVPSLPDFQAVIAELRPQINELILSTG